MSWTRVFSFGRRRTQSPPAMSVEDDIDEELMFHFRSLVDDNAAKGMPLDDAWRNAQTRFGSLRRYATECRRVTPFDRFLFQGLPVLGLICLGLLVGWILIDVRSLREEQTALLDVASQREAENDALRKKSQVLPLGDAMLPALVDLTGRVLDRQAKPIPDAKVLVILKTWPAGHYKQENFATTTDADGQYRLPKLVPTSGQRAVQVAAVKDGYAIASSYQLNEADNQAAIAPVKLELAKASRITLVVYDSGGKPVANVRVAPHSRRTRTGERHMIYFQASEPVHTDTDAEGRVGLDCFEQGDEAEIYLRVPGKDWEHRAITIPNDKDVIEVKTAQVDEGLDGLFSHSEFRGSDFTNASLRGGRRAFSDASFTDVNLSGASLEGGASAFQKASFGKATLTKAVLTGGVAAFPRAAFDGADLSNAQLTGGASSFQRASFVKANLTDAVLSGEGPAFQVASFEDANLTRAAFRCNSGTAFQGMRIHGTTFFDADLTSIDCRSLLSCVFAADRPPKYNAGTRFPVGFDSTKSGWQLVRDR